VISRFRDELADGAGARGGLGAPRWQLRGAPCCSRRVTVALSIVAMVLFPMYFLKSFAYAGIGVVAFAAIAAIVVNAGGDHVARGPTGRTGCAPTGPGASSVVRNRGSARLSEAFFYRSTKFVMRRAIPVGIGIITLMLMVRRTFPRYQMGLRRRPRAAVVGLGAPGF